MKAITFILLACLALFGAALNPLCGQDCTSYNDRGLCPRARCYSGKCISTRGTARSLFNGEFDSLAGVLQKREAQTTGDPDLFGRDCGPGWNCNPGFACINEQCHPVNKREADTMESSDAQHPGRTCKTDKNCPLRFLCVEGQCRPLRDITNPLAVDKRENEGTELADKIDIEQQSCTILNNCPPHTICQNGRCVVQSFCLGPQRPDGCIIEDEAIETKIRSRELEVQEQPACKTRYDCPEYPSFCINGHCKPFCDAGDDCADNEATET